jgi:hypothetical protein
MHTRLSALCVFTVIKPKFLEKGKAQWKDTILTTEKIMLFVRVTILTRKKRCSAFIMTAGFLSMNTTQSAFTNGQSIVTETRRLERLTDISAQVVTASELLSLFNVLRLSAYAIGFSKGFYR